MCPARRYVVVTDARGILLTGPDRGRPAPLGDSDGLAGRGWLGVVDDGSRFLVAHEPVLDPGDARVLGLVVAGEAYPSLPETDRGRDAGPADLPVAGLRSWA